jgi:GPI mannosyltransferase 3
LLGALAAAGLQVLSSYNRRVTTAAAALLVASCIWSAVTVRGLTFGDIGPFEQTRPNDSAFDDRGPVNRLLMAASRQPDICGLRVETDHLVWIGGYTYFHRDVPLYSPDGPARDSGFYNYIIATVKETEGNPVTSDGQYVLRRLRHATCLPDPKFDPQLPGVDDVRRSLGLPSR